MAAYDVISLEDARRAIRIPASDTTRDADLLETYVPAVTPVIEDVIGPVIARAFTVTRLGGDAALVLPHVRVTSITSVTVAGSPVTDYVADLSAGVLTRSGGFGATGDTVVVTYQVGTAANLAAVPSHVKLAARLILAWLWQRDQNALRPSATPPDASTTKTPSGFDIPKGAMSLLNGASSGRAPGFA